MKIEIEDFPYATTEWYSINVTLDSGETIEANICVEFDENTDSVTHEVNFPDKLPEDIDETDLEDQIIEQYNQQ